MSKLSIKVKGMVCGGCENRVKNAISAIDKISNVEADYKTGIVEIEVQDSIDKEIIEEAINDIGFEVIKED